ncbi:Uncharacterized conserved protein YbbK, DUF523 family [Terribacillus halophilus]|uniref:Uncharacterized conserved protein YbbK, DUF523 family n=1 Tax=Terribacillus halophilus TaxID=361279 RepID=A0A1G6QDK0_9BACI|nr:DUF523 domain-containing protein [Terribacillus halophilus]SDC90378.1 Uncharacterized conserved protein YbbK, DUF523 family [Terribacillus halophilus]
MIMVSACLAGKPVRYNGSSATDTMVEQLIAQGRAISVCPELLGGFMTPREPAEIVGGNGYDVLDGKAKVVELSGTDVTDMYIEGAAHALAIAKEQNVELVVLKENSPSCGSSVIYDGSFQGQKQIGAGVTTAMFRRAGIRVISEAELEQEIER